MESTYAHFFRALKTTDREAATYEVARQWAVVDLLERLRDSWQVPVERMLPMSDTARKHGVKLTWMAGEFRFNVSLNFADTPTEWAKNRLVITIAGETSSSGEVGFRLAGTKH